MFYKFFLGLVATLFAIIAVSPLQAASPQVITVEPAQYSSGVSHSGEIAVTFNMAMNPATINSTSFIVYGSLSGMKAGVISYDPVLFKAIFNPSSRF